MQTGVICDRSDVHASIWVAKRAHRIAALTPPVVRRRSHSEITAAALQSKESRQPRNRAGGVSTAPNQLSDFKLGRQVYHHLERRSARAYARSVLGFAMLTFSSRSLRE